MRIIPLLAVLLMAGLGASAQEGIVNPAKNPCAGAGGVDICALAKDAAARLNSVLPTELLPGVRVQQAVQGGPRVTLNLVVAADLRLPDAAVWQDHGCRDPRLGALITAGGQVQYLVTPGDRQLALITACKESP